MSNRPMYEAFTTPIGTAIFPAITEADTRFDPDGVYKVDISVPFEDAQAFIAKLERARDDFIATLEPRKQEQYRAVPVYSEEYSRPEFPADATDEEKDAIRADFVPEKTGNVLFKTKLKAKVTPKQGDPWTQAPVVVAAADGTAVTEPVYMGSIIRVKGQIVPYTNAAAQSVGITLRMKGVQVIELKTGSGGGSAYWTDFDNE